MWVAPYGWTWVGDEPWGWAPYHYGRWVYYNNGWCWAPRGYGYAYRRARWRPALVAFIYVPTSYGEQVCWYPLRHGQRDPRGRHWRRHEGRGHDGRGQDGRGQDGRGSHDRAQRYPDPIYIRSISSLPAGQFGRTGTPPRPATNDLAQQVIGREPVRGQLPISPPVRNTGEQQVPRVIAGRPPRPGAGGGNVTGQPPLPDRQTGAARRTPGVALDEELRRTRLYNGRDPQPPVGQRRNPGATQGDGVQIRDRADTTNTGAVSRPPRPRGVEPQPVERNNTQGGDIAPSPRRPRGDSGDDRTQPPAPTVERPDTSPPVRNVEPRPEPQPRVRPRRDDDNNGGEVAPRPDRRPEPAVEPRPERRPEPRREPQPERRPEPQPERRPEPRSEPRQESRPEPRQESRPSPPPERREESKPSPPPSQRESPPERPSRRGGR